LDSELHVTTGTAPQYWWYGTSWTIGLDYLGWNSVSLPTFLLPSTGGPTDLGAYRDKGPFDCLLYLVLWIAVPVCQEEFA